MPAEEGECDGKVHREDFPQITHTYKRRKLPEPNPNPVVPSRFIQTSFSDIGWKHGTMVDGNRLHWQCNWCGMIRYGGGVTRLKKHLSGSMDVRKCPFVPEDVSKMITNHMLMKQRHRRRKHEHGGIENINSSSPPIAVSIDKNRSFVGPELQVASDSKIDHPHLNNSTQRSQETSRMHENTVIELFAHGGTENVKSSSPPVALSIGKDRSFVGPELQLASDSKFDHLHRNNSTQRSQETSRPHENTVIELFAHGGIENNKLSSSPVAVSVGKDRSFVGPELQVPSDSKIDHPRPNNSTQRSQETSRAHENTIIQLLAHGGIGIIKSSSPPVPVSIGKDRLFVNPELQVASDSKIDHPHPNNSTQRSEKTSRVHENAVGGIDNIRSSSAPVAVSIGKDRSFVGPELQVASVSKSFEGNTSRSKIDHPHPNNSTRISQETSRVHGNNVIEHLEGLPNAVSDRNTDEQHDHATTSNCWSHWRHVLENMLPLQDEWEFGGVENCVSCALACRAHEFGTITKVPNVSKDTEKQQVSYVQYNGVKMQSERLYSPVTAVSDVPRAGSQTVANANTTKCKNALVDIFSSEKFALLCDLLWRNFQIDKRKSFFDFGIIDARMKNGQYEHSPGLCEQDVQQVWESFQNIGQNMVHLASCLSEVSRLSFQNQIGGAVESGSDADKPEEPFVDGVKQKNSVASNTTTQPMLCSSDHLTQLACSTTRNKSHDLHQSCAVCDRLELLQTNGSGERLDSGMQPDEPPELCETAISRLCKLCGTCEAEDKRFLICGHTHCIYKFYHIRCLKSSQITSGAQQNRRWYCPSCLCRACLSDKDDSEIVLCDRCDEAYHTYCMDPPRSSVPKGQWYCVSCNVALASEGMRKYEEMILQLHGHDSVRQASELYQSMDLLLSAAETLKAEEHLAAMT